MNPFRTENRLLSRGLFLEESQDPQTVLYTLKDKDTQGYPSLKRLYFAAQDPLETAFARKYFESLDHWERICQTEWFLPHITSWRRELELQIRADALAAIRMEALGDSKNAFQANKFLVSGGWKSKEPSTSIRGRPSKKEVLEAADKVASSSKRVEDDAKRLGLN